MPNALFDVVADGGRADFATVTERLLTLGEPGPKARVRRLRVAEGLPDTLTGNRGLGLSKSCIAAFRDARAGYFTWLFRRMTEAGADGPQVHVLPFERFKRDLPRLIQRLGCPADEAMTAWLAETPPVNGSLRAPAARYYDARLAALVRQQDAWLFDRFGYGPDR